MRQFQNAPVVMVRPDGASLPADVCLTTSIPILAWDVLCGAVDTVAQKPCDKLFMS